MTDIYYFDIGIYSDKIKAYTASAIYSEIRIGNKSVKDRMRDLFKKEHLIVIDDLAVLNNDSVSDVIMVFSASIYAKDLSDLKKFLSFASFAMINTFWGHENCFIYKGNKDKFVSLMTDQNKKDIYFLNLPSFISDLSSLHDVKLLLGDSHDSRHFNDIKSVGGRYVKKSTNSAKLKSEYEFLKNVPEHLKNYFVEVFEFSENPDSVQYSMVSYEYRDVAHMYLSNSLNEETFQKLLSLIQKYFYDARKPGNIGFENNSFDNLLKKNGTRFNELKKTAFYDSLNTFLLNFKGISLSDHHLRIQEALKKREKIYRKENYIFSHGDLCFSNILFSPQDSELKLIDPKGYENNGMRSPYYDMAKLSHSVYGNYDLIINNKVKLDFDENMNAFLNFSKYNHLIKYGGLFLNLVSRMKLDITLIRLIESSLFLSMIPLHRENKRKAFMLCLRSVEIFEDIFPSSTNN